MKKILIYLHLSIPRNFINWMNDKNRSCLTLSTPVPNAPQSHSYCQSRSWVRKSAKIGIGVREDTGIPGGSRLKTASPKVTFPCLPQ